MFVIASVRAMIVCALLTSAATAGCRTMSPQSAPPASPDGPAGQPTRPADASGSAAASDGERPQHTEADVRFMQGMIAHHAQALVMTALVPERAGSDDIRLVAERIEVSQRDEIALMQRWLRNRGEAVPRPEAGTHEHAAGDPDMMPGMSAEGGDGHLMPGMLTEEELARLAQAVGTEFDRLFLEYMIQHHEGALTMVARLLATPGAAQEPATFRFASDVNADQRMEIERMRAMLRTTPAREPRP